jgi:hypothetical protein
METPITLPPTEDIKFEAPTKPAKSSLSKKEITRLINKPRHKENFLAILKKKEITDYSKLSDIELVKFLTEIEVEYPYYSRMPEYKLIGFDKKSGVPVYMRTWYDDSKYTCEVLRSLRKMRGVGRSPIDRMATTLMKEYGFTRKQARSEMDKIGREELNLTTKSESSITSNNT